MQMPVYWRMGKQNAVDPYGGVLFSRAGARGGGAEKGWGFDSNNDMSESRKNYANWKKPDTIKNSLELDNANDFTMSWIN